MNSDVLRECPFCGDSEYVEFLRFTNGLVCVHCDNCGASGYASDVQERAIAAWNLRAIPVESPAAPGPEVVAILSEWRDEYGMRANSWLAVNSDSKEGLLYKAQVEAVNAFLAQQKGGADGE